jgi:hypothetical protein
VLIDNRVLNCTILIKTNSRNIANSFSMHFYTFNFKKDLGYSVSVLYHSDLAIEYSADGNFFCSL